MYFANYFLATKQTVLLNYSPPFVYVIRTVHCLESDSIKNAFTLPPLHIISKLKLIVI